MPRNVDPGIIRVGKGLAPEGTVEDNSLRYPERDVDPLRVHLHDPSRAHMAETIGIKDESDCYVSDEVEGALQEICGGASAGRLNGLVSGGTFDELGNVANGTGSVATTTLTLVNPTEIMVGPGVFDASALVADLSALGAGDYYVYFDTDSASPTFRTLVVSGTAPEVETGAGIEDVLLAKFSYDAGGNVTFWQDGRFFVRNLDRKVQYSSRQGENVDAWSEGCFATLEAFFLWMAEYGDGSGSPSEEEKGTVLIRGQHNITTSLAVPTDHLQFVGDGNAVLLVDNAPIDIFTLNNRTDITFRGIQFASMVAGSQGIVCTGVSSQIHIEDCTFGVESGSPFLNGVVVAGGPASTEISISRCMISFTNGGIVVDGVGNTNLYGVRIEGCTVNGPGASSGGSVGIVLGTGTGSVDGLVSGCKITDCDLGIQYGAFQRTRVVDTTILDVAEGVRANGSVNDNMVFSNCTIVLDDTDGLIGIGIDSTRDIKILGTDISNPRIVFTATPQGISVSAKTGLDTNLVVQGCHIKGFWDSVLNVGAGLSATGTNPNSFRRLVVEGNHFTENSVVTSVCLDATFTGNTFAADGCLQPMLSFNGGKTIAVTGNTMQGTQSAIMGIEFFSTAEAVENVSVTGNTIQRCTQRGVYLSATSGVVQEIVIDGNTIDGYLEDNTPPSMTGILLGSTDNKAPDQVVISANHVTSCADGILVRGFNSTIRCAAISITDNMVTFCAHNQDNHLDTFVGVGTKGIGLEFSDGCTVSGNHLVHIGQVLDSSDSPVVFVNDVYAVGIYGRNCEQIKVSENMIRSLQTVNNGIAAAVLFHAGSAGVSSSIRDVLVNDNYIYMADANSRDRIGVGFYASDNTDSVGMTRITVESNQILGNTDPYISLPVLFSTGNFSTAINVQYGGNLNGLTVRNNTIDNYDTVGIDFDLSGTGNLVRSNVLSGVIIEGNTLTDSQTVTLQSGIRVFVRGSNLHRATVNGIQVLRNVIPRVYDTGILLNFYDEGVSGTTYDELREVQISGNVINDVLESGAAPNPLAIRVEVNTTGISSIADYHGLRVTDNVVQYEDDANVPHSAIWLSLGETQTFESLEVSGNDVSAVTSVGDTLSVVKIDNDVPNTITGNYQFLNIHSNTIRVAQGDGGLLSPHYYGLFIDLQHVNVADLIVRSNGLYGGGGFPRLAALIDVDNTSATNATLEDLQVAENQVAGNFALSASGYNVISGRISENVVTGSTTVVPVGSERALSIDIQNGTQTVDVNGFRVMGNTISSGHRGLDYPLNGVRHENVRLEGNTFRDQKANNIGLGSAINVSSSGDEDVYIRNFHVDGNTVSEMGAATPIQINLAQNSGDCFISGVSVSRNTLSGYPGVAVVGSEPFMLNFDMGSMTSTDANRVIEDIRIEDNQIVGAPVDSTHSNYPVRGIAFIGSPSTVLSEVVNLSVSRNNVEVFHDLDVDADAIKIDLNQDDDQPARYKNFNVDENRVVLETNPATGGAPDASNALIRVVATASLYSASFSRNTLRCDTSHTIGFGLVVYHQFSTGSAFRVDPDVPPGSGTPNYVVGVSNPGGGSPTNQGLILAGTVDSVPCRIATWENLTLNGNTITVNAGERSDPYTFSSTPINGALGFFPTRRQSGGPSSYAVSVGCWGLAMSGNALGGRRYNGVAPFANNLGHLLRGAVFYGRLMVSGDWPGGGSPSSDVWLNRDWVVTGNTSRGFRVYSLSATSERGSCVYVLDDTGSTIRGGVVAVNGAQDNHAGAPPVNGWNKLGAPITVNNDESEAEIIP
jgi:hypothetical protein